MFQSRRQFLGTTLKGSTLVSLGLTVPAFLRRSALAAASPKSAGDRTLVVIQLSGGNDGLNTVIPFGDDLYGKNRTGLRIPEDQILKINDHVGLHPSLGGLSKLLQDGHLAVLQGIGYPNPSRSHFRSMDIWQTASMTEKLPNEGWLGRAIGQPELRREGTVPAIHFGSGKLPLALVGRTTEVPSLSSLADYKLQTGPAGRDQLTAVAATQRTDRTLQFLQRSTLQAYTTSSRLEEMTKSYDTPINYPPTELARKLKLIAQLIDAGFGTRIFYASLDGFDTHANQLATHANLLRELGDAVRAFVDDVSHHGHGDRVLLMTFSEFGRRVKENGSRGTDHGAGAPMFLAGGKIKSRLIGRHPSLSDLDDGDLKSHTDFRSVYATVLEDWLACPSSEVLGDRFDRIPLIS
jgi:uncharacterized protein (DUF1501 family)